MDERSVVEAEVSGLLTLSGLMLVFLPFFLDRLRATRERMSGKGIGLSRWMSWITAVLVVVPCVGAGVGLVTLWGGLHGAVLVGYLTLIAIVCVALYALLVVGLENTIWW